MEIQPIGVIRSEIKDREDMPPEGVPAWIDVHPRFAAGLAGVEGGSHIWVMGWFHLAGRDTLQTTPRSGPRVLRGIFSLRSPNRPNPISLNPCRILEIEGNSLKVERLDLVDGTPVVDIKRYSPSWDCLFSARSSRDLRVPGEEDREKEKVTLEGMLIEAANFHGDACVGAALGVRILRHAMREWGMAQKDPNLVVHMGDDGCIADALQGLTGATLGNGRMKVPQGRAFRLAFGKERIMAFQPLELPETATVEDVLGTDINVLFAVRSEEYAPGSGPHGGRPPKMAPPEEKQALLLERVSESVVNGALPCAVAHKIARDLGVGLLDVGWASDVTKVRITKCQLGCFK